jgi:hypothetical protein
MFERAHLRYIRKEETYEKIHVFRQCRHEIQEGDHLCRQGQREIIHSL